MSLDPTPRVLVLDVNETLSDLRPLRTLLEEAGLPWTLADLWFASVLRDGFALATLGQGAPFAEVGEHCLRTLAPGASDDVVAAFLRTFSRLPLHPDVAPGLRALLAAGVPAVTLSNGAASVAESLLQQAGISDLVGQVLSVEAAGIWKPAPAAYAVALEATGVAPRDAAMVAVHPWDLHGAAAAGLRTVWVDRHRSPYPGYLTAPDLTVRSLTDLARQLDSDD